MSPYTPAQEVAYLKDLYDQPIPIIAACNRVQAQEKRMRGFEDGRALEQSRLQSDRDALAAHWKD